MAHSGFWKTMSILVDKDWKDANEDIQEWLDKVLVRRQEVFVNDDDDESVIAKGRRLSECSDIEFRNDEDIEKFVKGLNLPKIDCKFCNPQIRSRLERLMGTNVVLLTDRVYMQRLQERILEDYEESMAKRIKAREEQEMDRVKNLVLTGQIPLSQAPPEMAEHPVMLIENYCNLLIAERRAKIKIPRVKIPTYLYLDDTPDPPSGLSIEQGHVFRKQGDGMCIPVTTYLQSTEEEDVTKGYMVTQEEYERLKYVDPMVKQLISCESVEQMYMLADKIIGALRTIEDRRPDEFSMASALSKLSRVSEAPPTEAAGAPAPAPGEADAAQPAATEGQEHRVSEASAVSGVSNVSGVKQ